MSFVDQMQTLREGIDNGAKIRHRRLKEISQDLSSFIKEANSKRKEDFEALTKEINQSLADLKQDVQSSRQENEAKQKQLKRMLAEAKAAFWGKGS